MWVWSVDLCKLRVAGMDYTLSNLFRAIYDELANKAGGV